MSVFKKFVIVALCCFSVNTFAELDLVDPTPQEMSMELPGGAWDVDGNDEPDALSDGLLILRYAFGLRDDSLTGGAIAPNSPFSESQIVSRIENTMSYADIDGNGEVDALSD